MPFTMPWLLDPEAVNAAFGRQGVQRINQATADASDAGREGMERTRNALDDAAAANREPQGATRRAGGYLGLLDDPSSPGADAGITAIVQRMLGNGSVPQPGGPPGAQPAGETGSVPSQGILGGDFDASKAIDSFANPLTMAGLATLGSFDRDPGKGFRAADDFSAAQRRYQIGQDPIGRGPGASRPPPTSATERVAARLMQEDPSLGFGEAINRARRSVPDDSVRTDSLALRAARDDPGFADDPTATLDRWRAYFGQPGRGGQPSGAQPTGPAGAQDRTSVIRDAKAAVQRGADPAAVRRRLEEMGVDATRYGF